MSRNWLSDAFNRRRLNGERFPLCPSPRGRLFAGADLYRAGITLLLERPFGVSPEPYEAGLAAGFPAYGQIQ